MLNQSRGLDLNSKGYLINFSAWDKDFATTMAKEHSIDLTECHWLIINFLRDYYLEYAISPDPRTIIKKLGQEIKPDVRCSRKHLEGLFSEGGCKLACKIAGLPDCHYRGL